jgi:hypothetical protein
MNRRRGYIRAIPALEKLKLDSVEQQAGVGIVKRALEEPLRLIAQNAGHEGSVVINQVGANSEKNFGFNAQSEKYENLVAAGVIDPTKVVRCALQNAASVSSLLLTTELSERGLYALKLLDEDKRKEALSALERATGKLELILDQSAKLREVILQLPPEDEVELKG